MRTLLAHPMTLWSAEHADWLPGRVDHMLIVEADPIAFALSCQSDTARAPSRMTALAAPGVLESHTDALDSSIDWRTGAIADLPLTAAEIQSVDVVWMRGLIHATGDNAAHDVIAHLHTIGHAATVFIIEESDPLSFDVSPPCPPFERVWQNALRTRIPGAGAFVRRLPTLLDQSRLRTTDIGRITRSASRHGPGWEQMADACRAILHLESDEVPDSFEAWTQRDDAAVWLNSLIVSAVPATL